jgi:TatA/E family protein of Tat protein translocase
MPTPGPLELVIILVIALLILGPGKLPDVGAALGKSIREFRKAASDIQDAVNTDTTRPTSSSTVQPPAAQPPAPTSVAAPAPPASAAPVTPPQPDPTTEPKP